MSGQIDAAFLALLNHGHELLLELQRGEQRIEGALKMKLDGFASAHSQAMNVAKYAQTPQNTIGTNGGVFDGGPVSAGVEAPAPAQQPVMRDVAEQHVFDVQAGIDLANANKPLPDDASPSMRQGYATVKPVVPEGSESIAPFNSDPTDEEVPPSMVAANVPGNSEQRAANTATAAPTRELESIQHEAGS